jgi:hypothetical protein
VFTLRLVLFAFGYPVSIVVIARWVPVVRQQRTRWLVAHHAAVVAIITGWAIKGDVTAVAVNSSWLVSSSIWYALGARRARAGRTQAGRTQAGGTPAGGTEARAEA